MMGGGQQGGGGGGASPYMAFGTSPTGSLQQQPLHATPHVGGVGTLGPGDSGQWDSRSLTSMNLPQQQQQQPGSATMASAQAQQQQQQQAQQQAQQQQQLTVSLNSQQLGAVNQHLYSVQVRPPQQYHFNLSPSIVLSVCGLLALYLEGLSHPMPRLHSHTLQYQHAPAPLPPLLADGKRCYAAAVPGCGRHVCAGHQRHTAAGGGGTQPGGHSGGRPDLSAGKWRCGRAHVQRGT